MGLCSDEQTQSRIRKVSTPASAGERGRVPAAARNTSVHVTADLVREIQAMSPDPDPIQPSDPPVSDMFMMQAIEMAPTIFHKMPKLSAPAPLGIGAAQRCLGYSVPPL